MIVFVPAPSRTRPKSSTRPFVRFCAKRPATNVLAAILSLPSATSRPVEYWPNGRASLSETRSFAGGWSRRRNCANDLTVGTFAARYSAHVSQRACWSSSIVGRPRTGWVS